MKTKVMRRYQGNLSSKIRLRVKGTYPATNPRQATRSKGTPPYSYCSYVAVQLHWTTKGDRHSLERTEDKNESHAPISGKSLKCRNPNPLRVTGTFPVTTIPQKYSYRTQLPFVQLQLHIHRTTTGDQHSSERTDDIKNESDAPIPGECILMSELELPIHNTSTSHRYVPLQQIHGKPQGLRLHTRTAASYVGRLQVSNTETKQVVDNFPREAF
jgi:hypothetical protein